MPGSDEAQTLPPPDLEAAAAAVAKLEKRIVRRRLDSLTHLEVNARYMTAAQHQRLVQNIKTDGCLTTTPLIYVFEDGEDQEHKAGTSLIISGNHRVRAGLEAGIEEDDFIEILTRIDHERRVAIQLSHNAIEGQDDPNLLQRLYASMGLDWKKYSGVTDDAFGKLKGFDLDSLSVRAPDFQRVELLFLPDDAQALAKALEALGSDDPKLARYAGHMSQWQQFFDTTLAAKTQLGITSTPTAISRLCELAMERLAQLGQENT